jgi:hypothetical protein
LPRTALPTSDPSPRPRNGDLRRLEIILRDIHKA